MSSELYSLPYYSTPPSHSFINGCSVWNYPSLGLHNANKTSLVMDEFTPYLSPRDLSNSGYLNDALLEFTTDEHSKRPRLLPCVDHEPASNKSPSIDIGFEENNKSFWDFNPMLLHKATENFYNMNQIEEFSDEYRRASTSRTNEEANIQQPETGTPEETVSASKSPDSFSSSYCKNSIIASKNTRGTLAVGNDKRKKRVTAKVAYPFALVKPGGREGDVTLNDINERILMRPTRPVKHPVGDFACRPCVSTEGPGLSGKEVVALTRIHTQGRGTITIIRTKG